MLPRAVHQLLPVFADGDAIGNHALEIRRLLRTWGYPSEIFADHWDPCLARECYSYLDYPRWSHLDNLLILHYSTGSSLLNNFAQKIPDRIVLYYHNITPAHFLYWVNGELAQQLDEARHQLKDWARKAPAIAGSLYNAEELNTLGYSVLGVSPYIIRFGELSTLLQESAAAQVIQKFSNPKMRDWLYVGRIAPNKCIHDIIKSFYYYHTWINSASRLFLVGAHVGMEEYVADLHALVSQLALDETVIFTGHVSANELVAYYTIADLYVSMSEHEGFCIPLIEAMHYDLPVIAYASTGVPSTLGDAGVLIRRKDFGLIAEIAHEILTNDVFRSRLLQVQRARLTVFAPDVASAQFRECLDAAIKFWQPLGHGTIGASAR